MTLDELLATDRAVITVTECARLLVGDDASEDEGV